MKLFQIEEPDGSPADPDLPGVAIGIDIGGNQAEVAVAVGGNAVLLADREEFQLNLAVPTAAASPQDWRELFEGARLRAERALAQPVTHAVIVLGAGDEAGFAEKLRDAAGQAGLTVLDLLSRQAIRPSEPAAGAAAMRAEDLAPRPGAP